MYNQGGIVCCIWLDYNLKRVGVKNICLTTNRKNNKTRFSLTTIENLYTVYNENKTSKTLTMMYYMLCKLKSGRIFYFMNGK